MGAISSIRILKVIPVREKIFQALKIVAAFHAPSPIVGSSKIPIGSFESIY
jgi:hypothetical protein